MQQLVLTLVDQAKQSARDQVHSQIDLEVHSRGGSMWDFQLLSWGFSLAELLDCENMQRMNELEAPPSGGDGALGAEGSVESLCVEACEPWWAWAAF